MSEIESLNVTFQEALLVPLNSTLAFGPNVDTKGRISKQLMKALGLSK
jgi:hypothetical protein